MQIPYGKNTWEHAQELPQTDGPGGGFYTLAFICWGLAGLFAFASLICFANAADTYRPAEYLVWGIVSLSAAGAFLTTGIFVRILAVIVRAQVITAHCTAELPREHDLKGYPQETEKNPAARMRRTCLS
ncbi:MAG: hypothetical protein GDA53_09670 [Rhodobacteraceae bacterium]|nr:hypothetical protein [Paracoccaceae bacterium]